MRAVFSLTWACACLLTIVNAHGRLRSPTGRSSMWRDKFHVPKNYQDNELNCGGRWIQWGDNGGKCGVCGDPYGRLQLNQPPNKYAQPIIAKCYPYGMKSMDVHIQLTANHLGFMEFRLCPNNDFKKPVTQECLDQNLLNIRSEDGEQIGQRYQVDGITIGDIFLKLDVPEGLTCSQCVLQWTYVAGNNWGCYGQSCERGQESFRNCADIAIVPDCGVPTSDVSSKNKGKAELSQPKVDIDQDGISLSAIIGGKTLGDDVKEEESDGTEGSDQSKITPKPYDDTKNQENNVEPETTSKSDQSNTGSTQENEVKDSAAQISESGGKSSVDTAEKDTMTEENNANGSGVEDDVEEAGISPGKEEILKPTTRISCQAVGLWARKSNMVSWCNINCEAGFCPSFICLCSIVPL